MHACVYPSKLASRKPVYHAEVAGDVHEDVVFEQHGEGERGVDVRVPKALVSPLDSIIAEVEVQCRPVHLAYRYCFGRGVKERVCAGGRQRQGQSWSLTVFARVPFRNMSIWAQSLADLFGSG